MLKQHDINISTVKFNSSFKCKQCDKIFEKKNSLVNHVKVHEHKTSVPEMSLKEKCQVCFKEVFQKNMKKHKAMLDLVHMLRKVKTFHVTNAPSRLQAIIHLKDN